MDAIRKAVVTGASSGIGLALARRLVARGAEVWLVARRTHLLDEHVRDLTAKGGRAHALGLDVGNGDQTVTTLTELDAAEGVDLVVANAGVAGTRAIVAPGEMPWADTKAILDVNLVGAAATFAAFIPGMLGRGKGRLVGISSLAADIPIGLSAAYSASKAGLTRYMESLDVELRPRGISSTIVHPGFVRTGALDGMGGLPLVVELDQAAETIERAILRRARIVRFPWTLGAVFRTAAMLPAALRDPMIRRATARGTPRGDDR